jgi:hypothetical protein
MGEVDSSGETPRGWPNETNWSDSSGGYDPETNIVYIATNSQQESGSVDFMLHEIGHSIDAGRGNESSDATFRVAYSQDSKSLTDGYVLASVNKTGDLEET